MAGAASGGLIGYHSNRPAITLSHFRDATQSLHRWLDGSLEELSSTLVHARGRKTWSVIETALPRLFELRSFSLVGIALVPPKR